MDKSDPLTKAAGDAGFLEEISPWEEIAAGRFMPRRIRGSYRGRVLG
jgi:hypothetical protein